MKKAKLKEIKQNNSKKTIAETQESIGAKKVIITLVIILITFGTFYFLTDFLISKRIKPEVSNSNTNTNTNTNEISFLDILEQSSKEYYVFALTDTEDEMIYKRYASFNDKKYYIVDMNDTMNKTHVGDKTSVGNSVKDITIKETTLFVVKDGKIKEHFTGSEDIIKYLQKNIVPNSNIKK